MVVIPARGYGNKISKETTVRPKRMVEIGERPIIWHIMKIYSHYGLNDFIICCGYKGRIIKEYFSNYLLYNSHINIDTGKGEDGELKAFRHDGFWQPMYTLRDKNYLQDLWDTGEASLESLVK